MQTSTLSPNVDFNDLSDEQKELFFQQWLLERNKPKVQLCHCNECMSILIDRNPTDSQPFQVAPSYAKEMVYIKGECEGEKFWACPECKTDGYLMDIDVIL